MRSAPLLAAARGGGFDEVSRNCVQFLSAIAMPEPIARTNVITRSMGAVGWRLSPSGYGMKAMHAVQYGAVRCVRCATVWHASARTADTPQMSPVIRTQPG